MRDNPVKTRLAEGQVVLGTMVFEFATPGLPALLGASGAEFVLYDMEHSGFSIPDMKVQFGLCRGAGIIPLVRPPEKTYETVAQLLDCGAMGLMLQKVESAAEAAEIVSWTRYPTAGIRGAFFGGAHDDFTGGSLDEKMRRAEARTIVMPMIESRGGVANVDEIVATPGVDGVHLGQYDLSLSLGLPGQFDHPEIQGAIDAILAACRRHGKFAACMAPSVDLAREWMARGFTLISYGMDSGLLAGALSSGLNGIREGMKSK